MTELPYTYTDPHGADLTVDTTGIFITGSTGGTRVADAPKDMEAVQVDRAILAAAGDTGHMVISQARLAELHDRLAYGDTHVANAARSMRERIADAMEVEYGLLAARMVETMPLLPDEDTAGHEGEHYALKGAVTWESEPDLASRVTELEALVADQANALEGHSRAIADLREQMSSAQAAIRGLGQSMTPTTTDDL